MDFVDWGGNQRNAILAEVANPIIGIRKKRGFRLFRVVIFF